MKTTKTLLGIAMAVMAMVATTSNAADPSWITNGLVAYYPFNGNANDASGNGNNGTVSGGVTLTTDRFGNGNSAYLFDGNSGAIDISSLNNFQYRPITYSAWIVVKSYFPNQPGHQFKSIVGRHQIYAPTDGILGFYRDTSAPNSFQNAFLMWRGGGASPDVPSSKTVPPTNLWIHLVFTHDSSGQWNFFQNGLLISSGINTDVQNFPTGFRIGAGNSPELYSWDSKIDDVRIYNRALSSNEVQQLYLIESPEVLNIKKAVYLDSPNLKVGTNYQIQVSSDLVNWTNYGSVFTATTNVWRSTNYWDVANWNQLYFRLQQQ
jgi:Concanavalin A-like lectin/glucanases superfamily